MRIVIASNIENGIGLERDFILLRDWLTARGHEVYGQQYNVPCGMIAACDLGIFIETISEHLVPMASKWWYCANPEWLKPELIRPVQRHCEKVLAKTRDAERVLRGTFSNVIYTGFLCADKMDKSVRKVPEFLHVGGNSGMRGTNAVISAWREYRYWDNVTLPPLTVISKSKTVEPLAGVPGITFIERATDEEITRLQNACLYHLQPSSYEGYGQAIHESQSVGAVLLTTQAPPMTELFAPFEVKAESTRQSCLANLSEVSPRAIREMIPKMLELPNYEVARMQIDARARWEKGNLEFGIIFGALVDSIAPPPAVFGGNEWPYDSLEVGPKGPLVPLHTPKITPLEPLRIALLGNFGAPYSTENDWAWSFESLGHKVIKFQENEDRTEEILKTCTDLNVRLFMYVHTHNWATPGRLSMDELIIKLREAGIKSVSPHLDLYFGLNAGDGRDSKVGKHAFWHTDLCMTADGSSQCKFAARGVNHLWLRPGVVARDCKPGTFQKELETEIAFVGAEGYHSEWPWRGEMIHTLREVYGDRFKVLTGFRGQRLNDLYASTKILIGDCCFAGKPKYYSDRWPETCGRGGFLLAPQIEGCCIPTATFTSQDVLDLMDKIDYYLVHDKERDLIRLAAHEHVKTHDTYTHRAQDILKAVNL